MNDSKQRMNGDRRGFGLKAVAATLILSMCTAITSAEQTKPFPQHWGEPPANQTRDYVELPDGYGHGSSTLAHWITQHIAQEQASSSGKAKPLYQNDFGSVAEGQVPDDFLVLNGDFGVKVVDGNKVLELPGSPLESFSLQFGPAQAEGLQVSARILGTSKGRLYPVFGVGLNGVGGYKLKINPARRLLELTRGDDSNSELLASARFRWASGTGTHFALQVRPVGEGAWRVEGKAWTAEAAEPAAWLVSYEESKTPINGRPSVLGSPYSGTPISYDDLVVTKAVEPQ